MTYALIAPAGAEPLTLGQVKAHLRVDGDDEDGLLLSLIVTAREHLERETGLCLLTQALRLYLDRWPRDGVTPIARGPVQGIQTVTVFEADGTPIEVSLEDHLLDGQSRPARLWLRDPPRPGQALNGIEIDFRAGYGDAGTDVPDTLQRAMLLHVAEMFAYRGVVDAKDQPAGVPRGYERLIAPFCRRGL